MGLAGILDHRQAVSLGYGEDWIHVGRLAENMNRDDGFGARRNGRFQQTRVQCIGLLLDVDEHRFCAAEADSFCAGNEGVGYGDNFIASAYA